MNSMTGFGSCEIVREGVKLRLDVKSVNHKNLDIRIKGLSEEAALELMVKNAIAKGALRGHFEVYVRLEGEETTDLTFVPEAYAFYENLMREKGASHPAEVAWLLERPGVVKQSGDEAKALDESLLMEAFDKAFYDLCLMRQKEGDNLKKVLEDHVTTLENYVEKIKVAAEAEKSDEKESFQRRVEEIMGEYEVDLPRFSTELALLYEKISIEEEIARLISHIDQFRVIMNGKGSVGRRLDFLLQEMFREANTIASKSRHLGILHDIVEVKTLIDHLREQVANIE